MSIEGIPNGWRLVRVGRVHHGETRIDSNGNPLKWSGLEPSKLENLVIIEMIEDAKQYREPELSDLANGPIEIEACTPDPHTGERRWRKRKLVAIQTGGRKPFVVQHPNQPGIVVCYKEARIEVVASSEASPADHIADANKMVPLAIPAGWRELHNGEALSKADLYDCNGKWNPYTDSNPAGSDFPEYNKAIHYRHIRKIETANQSERQSLAIPEGWRELDESDHIEQSDKYDDGNRWMPYTYDPASPKSVMFNKSIHVRHIRKIKEPATDDIPDANKMVTPAGYRLLDKSAKVEPRKAGDLFLSCSVRDWVELNEFRVEYANRYDWPACRKIETANRSETPSSSEAEPLAIPEGWRELEFGETRLKTDLYSYGGKWVPYTDFDPVGSEFPKYDKRIHHQHIRKIEIEKPEHVEGVWVEEADANAKKIEPTETSDASIPDPGPGYRLLSKDPPELVQEGDEFWCDTHWAAWWPSSADCGSVVQSKHDYYRRKIEPTEWIPKVGDKVRVVKPGRLTTGRTGVVSLRTGEYLSVWVEAEKMTSHGLLPKDLELIEAAS